MAFITLDIESIINSDGWRTITLDNGSALSKRIPLSPPQMEMFHTLNVTKLQDGTIWLDFISSKYAPNKTVMDFIAYCTDLWGLDHNNKGYPDKSDIQPLKSGRYGRFWDNVSITQINVENNIGLVIALRITIDNTDMSNFVKNLAKGFVRSAVNQVGRDGGRVISNNLYKGRNYVPVQNVNTPPPLNGAYQNIPESATINDKPFSALKYVLCGFLSFIFPIGTIGVFIYGLTRFNNRMMTMTWTESRHHVVADRRYKTGYRDGGYINVSRTAKVPADDMVIAEHKNSGKIIMIIAIIIGVILGISMAVGQK